MKPGSLWGEMLAELMGTAIILLFGAGVCAMVVLFGRGTPGEVVHGGYTNITIGWGVGVTMGVYVAGKVSGAHLNPAVTLALALFRGFPWRKVIPYSVAQTAGAFAGAALVFFNYREQFLKADPQLERTAGIFTTFPAFPGLPHVGFFDQVLGTALLLMLVLAVTDERNQAVSANLAPLIIGLIVVGIGVSFGALHGYAINPARDLGPRLFVTLAGFRNNGLIDGSHAYWVPIAGPLVGGVVGAAIYDRAIRRFLPAV
jgi:glycerol uptake facilitator protein